MTFYLNLEGEAFLHKVRKQSTLYMTLWGPLAIGLWLLFLYYNIVILDKGANVVNLIIIFVMFVYFIFTFYILQVFGKKKNISRFINQASINGGNLELTTASWFYYKSSKFDIPIKEIALIPKKDVSYKIWPFNVSEIDMGHGVKLFFAPDFFEKELSIQLLH